MIRINILNGSQGQVSEASGESEENFGVVDDAQLEAEEIAALRQRAVKNLIIMCLAPIGMLIHEQINIPDLESVKNRLQKEVNEVREKNDSAANSVQEIKSLKIQQDELQIQIGAIEVLKKDRYHLVKVLELVQKQLPPNMWLQEIVFSNSQFNLVVYSVSSNEELQFLDTLSKSIYFKEVRLIRSVEFNSNQFGDIKKVEISCVFGGVSS